MPADARLTRTYSVLLICGVYTVPRQIGLLLKRTLNFPTWKWSWLNVRKRTERCSGPSSIPPSRQLRRITGETIVENIMLKNAARSLVVAGFITFSGVGVANAAGAGDQTGQAGDMSGHGGPVDKKGGSGGEQKSGPAPEPSAYQKPGAQGSGYSGGTKPRREGTPEKGITNEKSSQGDGTTDTAGMGTGGQDDSFSMSTRKKGTGSSGQGLQGGQGGQGAGGGSGSSQGSGSSGGSAGSGGQ